MILKEKKIILGVCGSIAAYKVAYLIRFLVKEGAVVQVVMTNSATDFITPLTLSTLSKRPVITQYFSKETGEWNNHVHWGIWADMLLIAPATANTLAKAANGICSNLLDAIYLSARCPIVWCPAMDEDMWLHPTTKRNLKNLKDDGNFFIEPTHGELASGLVAQGRMADPEAITEWVKDFFDNYSLNNIKLFSGKKVLITAGPTYEAIDPVRFIGNHSSGKMGFALAETFAEAGAEVILITGATAQTTIHKNIKRIDVVAAQDMYDACIANYDDVAVAIMSAAVADYKPEEVAKQKIKKKTAEMKIDLVPTIDILAELGKRKNKQILVGFALETNNEIANAHDKLNRKNLDMIVLNSLRDSGAGFQTDTNKIIIIDKNKQEQSFELKSKKEVAQDIMIKISHYMSDFELLLI